MVSWLQQDTFRSFMFVGCVYRVQVLLDQGVRMGWTVSKTFGSKLVDEVSDGFNIKGVVQMGDKAMSLTSFIL
jgi:hypothetical protein